MLLMPNDICLTKHIKNSYKNSNKSFEFKKIQKSNKKYKKTYKKTCKKIHGSNIIKADDCYFWWVTRVCLRWGYRELPRWPMKFC